MIDGKRREWDYFNTVFLENIITSKKMKDIFENYIAYVKEVEMNSVIVSNRKVCELLAYVHDNFSDMNASITHAAELAGISSIYASQLFKKR